MLTIKTSVKKSDIEGLGLFAEGKIPKGTIVWKFDPRFDLSFDLNDVKQMPAIQGELINRYAYLSMEQKKYIYSIDNSRYMNHSSTKKNLDTMPIPGDIETAAIANRDIESGEELLIDYQTFDEFDAHSGEDYLKK